VAKFLQDICHREDPTRPVTCGMDQVDAVLANGFASLLDVPGFNYRTQKYIPAYAQLPQNLVLGSETASTVSSRGTYMFPVQVKSGVKYDNHQSNGYDVEACWWSNLPEEDFALADDYPWTIGQFVWTGFDYLGEPTPYDTNAWPSHSSLFGIVDLASLPKDRYWLYRSVWSPEEKTLHIVPHWTWPGREGELTPVFVYTNAPSAELFVNGKSQGRIRKQADVASVTAQTAYKQSNRLDRYRLRWNDVKYEPGEIKVVVYDADGKPAGEKVMRTAGKPARLQADVWTQAGASGFSGGSGTSGSFGSSGSSGKPVLRADGQDLAFVTVSLVDKNGTLIPNADDQLRFEVSGAGTFRAVCNGDATSLESFTEPTMKLFAGQLVVVVQAGTKKGQLTLKVTDPQRKLTQKVTIPVK
jgi:beta-galactosidase